MLLWLCIGIIFYVYAGYPLLLFLLSLIKARPDTYPSAEPSVTLLIAAYNESQTIQNKINNSLKIDYPREKLQIIITADGSDDGTDEIVRRYKGDSIELMFEPERAGKMAAINRAMPMAHGEVIVFSDANNMYSPDAIKNLIKPFADPVVGCVTGAKLITKRDGHLGSSEGLYWKYESFIRKYETLTGCCTGVNGEIIAIRRDLFEPPPANIINDDLYMALQIIRKGYRVVYVPEARSYEEVSETAADEFERRARIVAGRYQIMASGLRLLPFNKPFVVWQIISHKFMRPMVPFAMVCALILNAVAVWPGQTGSSYLWHIKFPLNWILMFLQCLFYLLAFIGNHTKLDGLTGKLLYVPTFLFNSNLAAMTGLYRFLSKKQTVIWKRLKRQQ